MRKILAKILIVGLLLAQVHVDMRGAIQVPVVNAAAAASCTFTGSATQFMGESYTFGVQIDNTDVDPGFKPVFEVLLPAEISFTGATFSIGGGTITPTVNETVTDNDMGDPLTGDVTNTINGEVLNDVPVGMSYLVFEPPVGSFAADQDPISINVTGDLAGGLDHNVALDEDIQAQCSFAYGDGDALNNPVADPPVKSGLQSLAVLPQVIEPDKEAINTNGDEDEVSTGPNFPYNYVLTADVATGEQITSLVLRDNLPDEVVVTEIVSANDAGNGCTIDIFYFGSVTADETTTCGALPYTPTMPGPGGRIDVTYAEIDGTGASDDASLNFEVYINELDASATDILPPATGGVNVFTNDLEVVSGNHTGHADDVTSSVLGVTPVSAEAITIQKGVSIFTDVGEIGGYNPGDTVQFTLNFQVSDFFSVDDLVIEDVLPDGLTYVASSSSMSITEAGVTTPGITFSEANVSEVNLMTGPPFDFAGNVDCLGCELAITADASDDDDATDPPSDGETYLLFDVSEAMDGVGPLDGELVGNAAGSGTVGTLTFRATIDDDYIDSDSVVNDVSIDTLETLTNEVDIYGRINSTGPGNYDSDASSASFSIIGPSVTKEVVAIDVGSGLTTTLPNPILISPGDNLVYRIEYTIPSGDADDLIITDFLPIPFFDADEFTGVGCGFQTSTLTTPYDGATTFPGACEIGYGDGTVLPGGFPLNTGSAPEFEPAFSVDSGNNAFEVDYVNDTTFDDPTSAAATVELYFNVTAVDEPFDDGLALANFISVDTGNSQVTSAQTDLALVNIVTSMPSLNFTKGAVSATEDTLVAKGVFDSATVGPSQLTYNLPGSSPSVTFSGGQFSSTELAAEPADSDASGLDAGDLVTFMLTVENEGSDEAHDIVFKDDFPTDLAPPVGGINLQLYLADGTSLTGGGVDYTVTSGGGPADDHFEVSMVNDLEDLASDTEEGGGSEGANIIIATYDLEVQDTAEALEEIINDAAVTAFASQSGGTNFVIGQESLFEDDATVTTETIIIDKDDNDTDQAHTGAGTQGPNAVVGEVVTYEIGVTLPEGTHPSVIMDDNLPNGFGYYLDNGVRIVDEATDPETCSLLVNDFDGTVPSLTVNSPTGVGVASSGNDLDVSFDSDIVVNNDNDPDDNLFCILYDVVVLDLAGINNGTNRRNAVEFTFGTAANTTNSQTQVGVTATPVSGEKDNRARINIVEPDLVIEKDVFLPGSTTVPTSIDAGDELEYRIKVDHSGSSSADAFDLEIVDDLSGITSDITVDTAFDADGLDNDGDGVIDEADETTAAFWNGVSETFTWNAANTGTTEFTELDLADEFELRFAFTVNSSVSPNDLISNQADLEYTSLPGTPGAPIPERTYTTDDTANFRIDDIDITKTVTNTGVAHTGTARGNGGFTDLAIGETVEFTIDFEIPESTITNLDLIDTLPDFIRLDSINVTTDGAGTPGVRTETITDVNNADGIDDTGTINYTTYTYAATTSQNTTTISAEFNGTVIDHPTGNNNLDQLVNSGSVDFDGRSGASPTGTVTVEVVEPELRIVKSVDDTGDIEAGDTRVFTITVDHHPSNSDAHAFDLEITDTPPSQYTVNDSFTSDGLDNTGSLVDDEPVDGVAASFWDGTTFTWNASNTGVGLFDELEFGETLSFSYEVTVDVVATAGNTITNTASIAYDSAAGVVADERDYSNSDDVDLDVENVINMTKTVIDTNVTQTGTSQFNGAFEDLTVGEIVTYQISVDVPQGTIPDFIITDAAPLAIEPQSASLISDSGVSYAALTTTISDDVGSDGINDTVEFDFGTITNAPDADTETITVEVVGLVLDNGSNIPANNPFVNNAQVEVDGMVEDTTSASVEIVAPDIDVNKTVTPLTGDGGDTHVYTLVLSNNGSGPAFDIEVTDVIPGDASTNSAFTSDGLDNDGDGVTDEADEGTGTFFSDPNFTWDSATTSNALFDVLPAGSSITIEYEVTLDSSVVDNQVLTNDVDVDYDTYPGTDPNGEEQSLSGSDDADITAQLNGNITKTITSGGTDKTIGDTIPYRLTVTVPEGTTTDLVVTDDLPAGLVFVPGSASVTTSNDPQISIGGSPTPPNESPASSGIGATQTQTLTFDFDTVVNSNTDNGTDEEIYIDYTVVVMNTSDNADSDTKQNNADADLDGNVSMVTGPTVDIEEPILDITKTTPYTSGDTVTYTMSAFHTSSGQPSAYEVVITDVIPAGLTYNGNITVLSGPTPTVDTTNFPTVTFTYTEIDGTYVGAGPAQFTYDVGIPTNISSGSVHTNNVSAEWTGQSGSPAEIIPGNNLSTERTGDDTDPGGVENDYNDTDSATITVTRPDLSTSDKTVVDLNGGDVQGNDVLEYTITVRNTGNLAATGVRVTDDIPANVNSLNVISIPTGSTNNSIVGSGGANGTGFLDIDDINLDAFGGPNDERVIVYRVTVDSDIESGTDIDNDMTVEPADEGGPGGGGGTTSSTLEPDLSIVKTVNKTKVSKNEKVTYTVQVTNNGDSPSLNAVITDILPAELTYVSGSITLDTIAQTDSLDLDGTDFNITNAGGITVNIPSIGIGATVTLTYDAEVGKNAVNTVTVTDDHGENESDDAEVTIKSSGGSGSIPDPDPEDPVTLFEEEEGNDRGDKLCYIPDKEKVDFNMDVDSCLELNANRNLAFGDLTEGDDANPFILTLKNTRIKSTGDYVFSGNQNHSTGKQQDKFRTGEWSFEAGRDVTRLEVVKTALVSNCIPVEDEIPYPEDGFRFVDIPTEPEDELMDFVARVFYTGYKHGVVNGFEDVTARPFESASNAEANAILLRAADAIPFSFGQVDGPWYTRYMLFSEINGVLSGISTDPSVAVQRNDFAKMVARVMAYNPNPEIHGYIERVDMAQQTYQSGLPTNVPNPEIHGLSSEEDMLCVSARQSYDEACLMLEPNRDLIFSDVPDDSWSAPYIELLRTTKIAADGDFIVSGINNHSTGRQEDKFRTGEWSYRPDELTTRLELVKVALVSNCIPVEDEIPYPEDGFRFVDIPDNPEDEVNKFIARVFYTAYNNGIATGRQGIEAKALEPVTRAEAIEILSNAALDVPDNYDPIALPFNDTGTNEWYAVNLSYAYTKRLIGGEGEQKFRGERMLKRSEMARLVTTYMLNNKDLDIRAYSVAAFSSLQTR